MLLFTLWVAALTEGSGCSANSDCDSGLQCRSNICVIYGTGDSCRADNDCSSSLGCLNGVCTKGPSQTPPAAPAPMVDKKGRPLLSWRVAILPYIEGGPLHKQFHLDEPWDSPHNRQFLNKMPPVYAFPDQDDDGTRTYIQAIVGPETAFLPGAKWRFDEKDEEAPVMVIEARDAVPWTKPADVRIEPGIPVPAVGGGTAESTAMSASQEMITKRTPRAAARH